MENHVGTRKNKVSKALFIGLVTFLMVISTSSVILSQAEHSTEIIKIKIEDAQQLDALEARGAQIIAEYNNGYVLAKVLKGDSSYFGRYFNVEKTEHWNTIYLSTSGISLNTLGALPSLPTNLMGTQITDEHIIQFVGPIKKEWIEDIENMGGDFYSYFSYYSFLVKIPSSKISAVKNLPYVNWIGTYQPAYKIAEGLMDEEGMQFIAVYGYDSTNGYELANRLDSLGATVHTISLAPPAVLVNVDASIIPDIAAMPGVMVIYPEGIKETMDAVAGKIHKYHYAWYQDRSGLPETITGTGEVAGILDSGFDVADPNDGHVDFFDSPNGDRIIEYYPASADANFPDGWGYRCEPHGTACAGIIASDGYAWELHEGLDTTDKEWHESEAGAAPEAQLTITGAPGPSGAGIYGWLGYMGNSCNLKPCWDAMYLDDGAKAISNSWGGTSTYNPQVDLRIDKWNDLMVFFSAGNSGPSSDSISEGLALSKNGMAVGASQNYRPEWFEADNPNLMASFSSRGGMTTSLGRIKPDIVAIGTAGITTMGVGGYLCNRDHPAFKQGVPQPSYLMDVDEYNYTIKGPGIDGINDYRYFSGTSQASPMAAGNYLLVREYLREIEGIANPSSDLAKALFINGAARMNEDLYDYPGWDQGWGRVDVQESLFPTPPRTNQFVEGQFNNTGTCDIASGSCTDPANNTLTGTINTNVYSSDVPLKVTLAWIDYQGDALVRDLDLRIVSPSGTEYRGNFYGLNNASNRGWSIPDPHLDLPSSMADNPKLILWDSDWNGWDDLNNVEQVEVEAPEPGIWTVEVIASSIPIGVANFSVVFAADVGPQVSYRVDLRSDHTPAVSVALGGTAFYPFIVTNYGTSTDSIDLLAESALTVEFTDPTISDLGSLESRDSLAIIKADEPSLTPGVYPLLIKGISVNDPLAQDSIEITVEILSTLIPAPIQITTGTTNDVDPSVLVLDNGTGKHIFIAYIKTVPTDLSAVPRLGGETVWLTHTTLDDNGIPVEPWDNIMVSDLNDFPNDLRFDYFKSGTYQGRIVLIWTGYDPWWATAQQQFDFGSWGRIAYADPPYDTWNVVTIDENSGEEIRNAKRVNFALIRETTQEIIYVFEYLGSTDSESPVTIVQTWYGISTDGGATWTPAQKLFPPPGPNMFYFFPTGCVDQNDVAWIFVYYRLPTGNDRDLRVALYDGSWSSTTPMIWDTPDNVQFPACMSTGEGAFGNRVYFAVTRDLGSTDMTVWLSWTDGDYSSADLPTAAPVDGFSASFNPSGDGTGRSGPGQLGPYTVALSDANYDRGPLIVLLNTTDPVSEKTWITYMENSHLEVPPYPANSYGPNIWTLHSSDDFATPPELIRVTDDAFPKGHKMADALQIGDEGVIYEVFHANKGSFETIDYNIYLTIYTHGWETKPDLLGPKVESLIAIENPFNITSSSFELVANINDAQIGMSGIAEARYTESPTSIFDSDDVDWSLSIPMSLSGSSPTEIANATVTPVAWSPGEVHRFWVRGMDSEGNWGKGAYVDVHVVGPAGTPPGAPTLLSVELSGAGNSNVTLTWSLSPDDGAPNFDGYEIYAGNIYNTGRLGYALIGMKAAGETTYTHVGAGIGDIDDYFYIVVARDTQGFKSVSADQGAKIANYYTQGRKLISIPLNLSTDDISIILSTLDYNVAWWYDPMDALDHWKTYNPSKPINELGTYNRTMAVWVDIVSDSYLTVAGMVPGSTDIPIYTGWNLIGYPSYSSKKVGDALSTIAYERIEGFDENAQPEHLKLMDDDELMTVYIGYWVKAKTTGTLSISNP